MADQDAQDISQMMSAGVSSAASAPKKSSKLLWIVLGCMVVGVGLGIFVYQQSIVPPPPVVPASPRVLASPAPVASPAAPVVNVIQPVSNIVTFPKAGTVRIYFAGYDPTLKFGQQPELVRLTLGGVNTDVRMPTTAAPAGAKMFSVPTTLQVVAGSAVTVKAYDLGNLNLPAHGWIAPNAQGQCVGSTGAADASEMIAYAQAQAKGEPLVSQMCWADNGSTPLDDYNDFFMILSYAPPTGSASPSPSASATVTPSASPSPSPSKAASPSPSTTASVTPTPSPRVTMPDTSEGTPVTGVFEVTVGTISVGLILLVLGLIGLLAL